MTFGKAAFGKVSVDIVWHTALPAGGLQLEFGEESTNDGKAGAYQADGGLDMRPEGGFEDRPRRVLGMHPEQGHNAVYTGEANEDSDSKDAVQSELITPIPLQVPDHGNGQA